MIGSLQTWQWAVTDDASGLLASVTPDASVATLAGLRARWSPDQIAVATEIVRARAKAAGKFPAGAPRLVADREGLEMASSARAAAHKAARFREALGSDAPVLDACCGIGGDAMGLAGAGLRVTALDLDERRAWMGGHNAGCPSIVGDARSAPAGFRAIHADPARRSTAGRTHATDAFEPPLLDILPLLARVEGGAIKLHPGVRSADLPEGELEIISEGGVLTQAVFWTGSLGRAERTATLLAADGSTHSISGPPDRPDDAAPVGAFIHTMDPSLERADLVGSLLGSIPLRLVFPGTGLLTGSEPADSPWLTPFRVIEASTWNHKSVRARLRSLDAGEVTVKTRAGVVDADRLSRELRGRGERPVVLFVLPIAGRPHAIIAERANAQTPPGRTEPTGGVRMERGR